MTGHWPSSWPRPEQLTCSIRYFYSHGALHSFTNTNRPPSQSRRSCRSRADLAAL
jgi:hypothetical protein